MSKNKIIFLLIALALMSFLFIKGDDAEVVKESVQTVVPAGWREYRSDKYKFGVSYPKEIKASEYDEGGGASTIIYEDVKNVQGFQVFVTPYQETQVSIEKFKSDVPSGAMKEPREVLVASSTATAFYNNHPILGELFEVWFIKNGFLYEVTTLKSLEPLLTEIIKTWRFI